MWVRLRDHGAECIEVVDNGGGVSPDNYAAGRLTPFTFPARRFVTVEFGAGCAMRGINLSYCRTTH